MTSSFPRSLVRPLLAAAFVALLTFATLDVPSEASAEETRPSGLPAQRAATSQETAKPRYAKCWRRNKRCYSAISVNMVTGKASWKINAMTKRAAIRSAARRCAAKAQPSGCRRAGWVTNGWLAVYYREVDGIAQEWASGIRYGETAARKRARNRLVGAGQRKAWTWVGTDRSPRLRARGREYYGQW